MSSATTTVCPRCDYDLCGQVESWRDECPMHGTCPECGLDFSWSEVFKPAITIPDWSFEHATRYSAAGLGVRFARTLAMLWAPRRLWRTLPMGAPPNWLRAGVIAAAGVVMAYAVMVLVCVGLVVIQTWVAQRDLAALQALANTRFGARPLPPVPTIPQALRDTAGQWGLPFMASAPAVPVAAGPAAICAMAVVAVGPCFALLPMTLRRLKVHPRHLARVGVYGLVLAPVAASVFPITRQVWALMEALATRSGWFFGAPGWVGASEPWDSLADWLRNNDVKLTAIVVMGLAWVWWGLASSKYLRIPRPWFTSGVLVFVAGLATLTAGYFVPALNRTVVVVLQRLVS